MILIIGGTGALGQATAKRLLNQGETVRVMTREPERAAHLEQAGAEIVQGNLLDKASLARACQGATRLLAAAHSIAGRGREASKYVDLQGHIDLIDVAKSEGIEQFVYTSAYVFSPDYETVPFFHIKREVEAYLKASGLPYVILRPTAFIDSHAHDLIGKTILETGKANLLGKGERIRNFVAADDVAQFATMALTRDGLNGRIIDIGGPTNCTNMDVVRLYEQLAGQKAKVMRVPTGALRVLYRVLRPFHPGLSQIMQFSLYNELADHPFDPLPMLTAYPNIQPTTLEAWVAERVGTDSPQVKMAV